VEFFYIVKEDIYAQKIISVGVAFAIDKLLRRECIAAAVYSFSESAQKCSVP
jgi:hypothetical protein